MKTLIRFHGTSWENVQKILDTGVKISESGTLGPGFYCGPIETAISYSRDCFKRDKGTVPFILVLKIRVNTAIRIQDPEDLPSTSGFDAVEWKNETCVRDASDVRIMKILNLLHYYGDRLCYTATNFPEVEFIDRTQYIPRQYVDLYLKIIQEFKDLGWSFRLAAGISQVHFYAGMKDCNEPEIRTDEDPPLHLCRDAGVCYIFGKHSHIHCLICKEPPPFPRQVKLPKEIGKRGKYPEVTVFFSDDENYVSLCNRCLALSEDLETETIIGLALFCPDTKDRAKKDTEDFPVFKRWKDAISFYTTYQKLIRAENVEIGWQHSVVEYLTFREFDEDFRSETEELRRRFIPET